MLLILFVVFYEKIKVNKLFSKFWLFAISSILIAVTSYYFKNFVNYDWKLPILKYMFLIITSKLINLTIDENIFFAVIEKYINFLPISKTKKNNIFEIFATSYSVVSAIILSDKLKFRLNGKLIESFADYLKRIEMEIDKFLEQKNNIVNPQIKLYSFYDLIILIIFLCWWCELEYSVFGIV